MMARAEKLVLTRLLIRILFLDGTEAGGGTAGWPVSDLIIPNELEEAWTK